MPRPHDHRALHDNRRVIRLGKPLQLAQGRSCELVDNDCLQAGSFVLALTTRSLTTRSRP